MSPKICPSRPTLSKKITDTCSVPGFYMVLGIRTQTSVFIQQTLYPPSHLPTPRLPYDSCLSQGCHGRARTVESCLHRLPVTPPGLPAWFFFPSILHCGNVRHRKSCWSGKISKQDCHRAGSGSHPMAPHLKERKDKSSGEAGGHAVILC